MTRDEFIKYVCDQFRDVFKNNYDDKKAYESANKLADTYKNNYEEGKEAVQAIIKRTQQKLGLHDSDRCILRVKMGDDIIHFYAKGDIRINADKYMNFFKPDEPIKEVVDRVKDKLNYKGEVKAFDVNENKWVMKFGPMNIDVRPDGHVFVNDVLQSWTIDPRKPFQDIIKEIGDHLKAVPSLKENLEMVKEQLHDAPVEVKSAYNSVIDYFANDKKKYRYGLFIKDQKSDTPVHTKTTSVVANDKGKLAEPIKKWYEEMCKQDNVKYEIAVWDDSMNYWEIFWS